MFYKNWGSEIGPLASGLRTSIEVTAVSLVVGLPLGLLLALLVNGARKAVSTAALIFVELGRGMPILVLLELVYFGLPTVHLKLAPFAATVVAFGWSIGAYTSETIRAAINSVPPGQSEAAMAVGMSRRDAFRDVIFPQALRIAIPPVMSTAIVAFQASSLAFAIALPEMMSRAYETAEESFDFLNVFILAALLYAAVSIPAAALVSLVERRLDQHQA